MKKIIEIIGLLTMICLLGITLGSCGGKGDAVTEGPDTGIADTKKAGASGVSGSPDRPSYRIGDMSSDTLILTVGSSPVYWPEFCFWLKYIQKYYRNYNNIERITDWGVEQNGMGLKEFFLTTAAGYACKDRAIEARAEALGITLSEHDLSEMEERRQDNISIYGSESEYVRIVSSMYVTEDVFKYLSRMDYLGNYLFARLYGEKGEKCTDREVSDYVKDQGIMCAKYIFFSNTDAAGNDLDAEKRAEDAALVEDILDRLDASDDPLVLFEELMREHGDDRDLLNYPDGRLFVSGAMGQEFEDAYLKLGEDRYSGIVPTENGCYIILRKPVFPDMTADSSGNTLRYHTAYDHLFKDQVEEWSSRMDIRYEDAYYNIDMEGIQDY